MQTDPSSAGDRDSRLDMVDLIAIAAVGVLALAFAGPSGRRDVSGQRGPSPEIGASALGIHRQRASERGRGRHSSVPWRIPLAGWKDIFWRTYEQITRDRLLAVAAGVVFYGLLAIFPAITAFVSIYGLFADVSTVQDHVALLAAVVPAGAMGPIEEQIQRLVMAGNTQLSLAFGVSFLLTLWSANAGMKAIVDALNVAYDEEERRGFVKLTLISLAMTVAAIVAGVAGIGGVVVFPVALSYLGVETGSEAIIGALRWPLLFGALLVGLALLYRFAPDRREPRWEWLSVGSVFAAVAWLAGSALLSWYFSNFADYNATYGSLAAGIGLMMWMWLSAIIVLVGAELNAEIEHQTAQDTTIGKDRPLGLRGAMVADTVGEARG